MSSTRSLSSSNHMNMKSDSPRDRVEVRAAVFPSITEDASEDEEETYPFPRDDPDVEIEEGRKPEETHKIRERLTSIARMILSGGSNGDGTRPSSVGKPEDDKDVPPFISPSEASEARIMVFQDHSEKRKALSVSPEKMDALGLSTSPAHTPKSHSPPPHHFHATFSDHSIPLSSNNKRSAASTPKRVSFDSPRPAVSSPLPAILSSNEPLRSDPPSPILSPAVNPDPNNNHANSRSGSRTRSMSPFHLWPLRRSRSREDPFIPLDPYTYASLTPSSKIDSCSWLTEFLLFYPLECAKQLYLILLLRLPSIYFSRVGRVFEYAELTKSELQRMIELGGSTFLRDRDWNPRNVPPSLSRFKVAWEELVDTLLKEWKTLNLVSALLLSAILTIFQTNGSDQPVTRMAALISLICALWSLIFGCLFILRFQTMRAMRKACRWAEAAEQATTSITWNVWVFLSLPAVFLSWSLIAFVVSILAYTWTTGTTTLPAVIGNAAAVWPRLGITCVFVLGMVYFVLVVRTFRSYAEPGERAEALKAVSGGGRGRIEQGAWISSPRLGEILDSLDADLERGLGPVKGGDGNRSLSSSPPPIGRADSAADVGTMAIGDVMEGGGSGSNTPPARVVYDRGRLPRNFVRSPSQQAKGGTISRRPSFSV